MKLNRKTPLGVAGAYMACFALSLTAYADTAVFNAAGTTQWVCPPGVISLQVEAWGGGGAGGAGRKDTATGSNTSQNGGGGGGGAYARRNAIPVTPGQTYTVTIPAAAISGSAGTTTNGQGRVNGGTVTFVGDVAVTVTAAGGTGGANAYTTANSTVGAAAGAGGTTAASLGDVTFAGGAGSAGNTGATNVSGSGGGGAGDASVGGAGFTSVSIPYVGAGVGGITGGGDGGVGRTGNPPTSGNTNAGPGNPGSGAGGGGGGGKNQGINTRLGGAGGLGQIVFTYTPIPLGPPIAKDNNSDDLNLTSSWVGGVAPDPGSSAKWDSTVTSPNTTSLGADVTFAGITIENPAGPVTINPGNTLTLGVADVDLDLSTATQDLTINSNLAMNSGNVWNVASGRTLTLGGVVSGFSPVTKQGLGLAVLSGANTYTGNTTLSGGTLNITGSITGNGTSTNLAYGNTTGNTIVNISGSVNNYKNFTGANVAGSNAVMNLTSGSASTLGTNGGDTQYVAQNGGYGYLNVTGGTFITGRFDAVGITGGGTAVVYVGGTGTFNNNSGDWLILPRTNGTGQLTVGPGGSLVRTAAVTSSLAITMNGTNSYGALNVAGGNVDTGTRAIQFGFGTSAASTGNQGFVNLAGGTLSVGLAINQTNTAGSYADYFNFAGGTLKLNAPLAAWIPAASIAGHTSTSTIFGPITNNNNANTAFNTQIGPTSNFTGGLTVDTNGFATTLTNAFGAATGFAVTQDNIGDVSALVGNSGYIGAPAVQFSVPSGGGVPATGYAVIDAATGKVNGIIITNPGTYASGETPTITLTGGGGTIAPFTTTALATANTSGGLTKIGLGTLTLSGANTYTGPTLVSGGLLQLNGSSATALATSSLTVDGGSLGFTSGTTSTLDLNSAPFTVNGSLAFELGSSGVSDSIEAGSFTLTGNSALTFNPVGAISNGGSYTLLTSDTPITTGGFSFSGQTVGKLTVTPTINTNTVTAITTLDEAIWNQSGGGDWSVGGNWTGYTPSVTGDAALFGSAITGPATINVDAPQVLGFLRLNNTNAITLGSGGNNLTFDNGSFPAIVAVNLGSHIIAENVVLVSNTILAPASGTTLTVSGNVSGTGTSLNLSDAGTLVLSGTNTHTGGTNVSAGTLSLTGSLTAGGAVTVSGTGVLSQDASGLISGATVLTHSSSATSTLAGANTYTGATTVSAGTLNLTGNRTAASTATFTVGNTVGSTATVNISNGTFTLGTVSVGAGDATAEGIINQTGGTLTLSSTQLILGNLGTGTALGSNSTGTYNLSAGTLTGATSTNRGIILGTNRGATGTFNLSGTGVLAMGASNMQIGRFDAAATNTTGVYNQTGGTATFGSISIGGGAGATFAGTSGTLSITGGTFSATTFSSISASDSSTSTINIGGTADVTLPAFPTARGAGATATINFDGGILKSSAASATYMGGLTNAFIKAGGANFDTTAGTITITQDLLTDTVSTGGGLTKSGTNTLTLSGANTYTGGTTVTSGVLNAASDSAFATGSVSLSGGTRILVNTGFTIANNITLGANTGVSGAGLIQAGTVAGTATVSGAISINNNALAGGHFAAPAGATLHVAGPITSSVVVTSRTGNVMFSGGGTGYADLGLTGTVIVGATNGLATTAAVGIGMYGAAGTLDLNGFNQSLVGITKGANAATIGNSSTATDSTLTTTGTSVFAGVIQNVLGSGDKTVALAVASGSLTLSGANTYTGGTTVTGGTLVMGNASALGSGTVSVGSAGTLAGSGSIGATTLNGTLAPGDSGSGLVTLASATVGSTAQMQFQLAATGTRGTAYDALTVSGPLALDGTITVSLNGLTPADGQSFDLIDATGALDLTAFTLGSDLILPALPGGLAWNTSAFATTGALSVVADPVAAYTATFGLSGNDALPSADPDGDGITNDMEYALGISPIANNGPEYRGIASVSSGALTLTYRRPIGGVPGVTYGVDIKNNVDLVVGNTGWTPGVLNTDFTVGTPVPHIDGTTETVTITITVPVSGKKFARLSAAF